MKNHTQKAYVLKSVCALASSILPL